jgi:hypothetical protein
MIACNLCSKTFKNKHALTMHMIRNEQYRNSNQPDCIERKRRKIAKTEASRFNPEEIVETMNTSSKTNDLMKQMSSRLDTVIQQNQTLQSEISEIKQQNNEMKDIMRDIQTNPQLIVLCDKLYPLDALREIDLKTPAFRPVLEILDKELPEYANLGNTQTQKAHSRAVRKLNQIQPTAVEEGESVYFKRGETLAKDCSNETTKEFINVFSLNGYDYARKASKDLESVRESDKIYQKEMLNYARKDAFPGIKDV